MKKLAFALALMLTLAACSSGDSASEEPTDLGSKEAPQGLAAGGGEGAPYLDEVTVNFDVPNGRRVVRRASLTLRSTNTRQAFDSIVDLVDTAGGFVANADVAPVGGEDEQPSITLTLRVPSGELREILASVKDLADEVVAESQGADDVTEQFVDLEARLTNLQALEEELRALLVEVRQQPDADPDKLLRVFAEVSNVRGQIEQIQGQLNYLNDVVDLATVQVSLSPTPSAVPIVEDEWRPLEVARDAVRQLVAGLQDVTNSAIHFVLFLLPMLLLWVGLPGLIAYFIYRRWRRRPQVVAPRSETA